MPNSEEPPLQAPAFSVEEIRRQTIFELYRDYVKHHYDLINHRVTWYLASQSFFFASYVYILQYEVSNIAPISDYSYCDNHIVCGFIGIMEVVCLSISLMALIVSGFFWFLFRAASVPVDDIFHMWRRINGNADRDISLLPNLTGGTHLEYRSRGRTIIAGMPLITLVAWSVILLLTLLPMVQGKTFVGFIIKRPTTIISFSSTDVSSK